ncbi:propionyl-CoA carboxylase, carboxyltransferase subunit [Verrucomicrobia bacterium]|nr:propionyl-CoA carboxylase, carboxyltransferase subunit [Verrucomicrobiota bacterium]
MAIPKAALDELEKRRTVARAGGGQDKLDARRKNGLLTARDRIERLFQPGTFQEWGLHADHDCHHFGLEKKSLPGDGVITGTGMVDGRLVAAFSQDFTVSGGSLGRIHAKKICDLMDYALKVGCPILGFNDSGGARIQEGDHSLSGYGQVFFRNVLVSGVVPQIAIVAGPCAGGAAYSPALMDFIIMVKDTANMFICGPEVIQAVTGQKCTMEEIGSPLTNASVSGNVHFIADNDLHAIEIARKILSFVPANNLLDPPHHPAAQIDLSPDPELGKLVPGGPKDPMDVLQIILRLVDRGDFLEVHKAWARNIVVGLGRLQGVVVGVIANNSAVKAGTLDIDSSDKAARFIRFCNVFNIPLLTLVDVPGFMPGVQQERGGIIRHGAKMLFAYAAATVPKLTLIMRKAYGGAYLAMCSADMGADYVYAWPAAEIAVMGAEGAVKILYKREITAAKDAKAKEAELVAEYRQKFCSPYEAARNAMITDVIAPAETRSTLSLALRNSLTKRETRPPKKHGTIPM